jgi:uncharacterized membrane protein YfcA
VLPTISACFLRSFLLIVCQWLPWSDCSISEPRPKNMLLDETAAIPMGTLTGVAAGFASGLLGVSPGGILVPIISLTLGLPQHLAQAVSLVAQAPPTSISGISEYSGSGRGTSLGQVAVLALGFLIGGLIGAILATHFSDHQLRWMFVAYLLLLALLAGIRGTKRRVALTEAAEFTRTSWSGLALIGMAGGISSGLLGIGGGLAITALSVFFLKMSQHQAQAVSLTMTALPLTLPAAFVYVRQGLHLPWWAILGIVLGLVIGTKAGAMLANRLPERNLKLVFIALILAMAIYMAISA